MLHTLVAGLGRAGAGLHLRVLAKARAAAGELFQPGPVLACDPMEHACTEQRGVTVVDSVRTAAGLADPSRTAVHVCTPPVRRPELLRELAGLGYRRIIVEKPLAADSDEYAQIASLRERYGLNLAVVAHWLESALTTRLARLLAGSGRGRLRSIRFAQHKPRFHRSLVTSGHPTAFDVELPHSLGVVLRLAGPAGLVAAECSDMRCGHVVAPRMGAGAMTLRHDSGVLSELRSDLTAPVRERSITLEFEHGRVTGHYPLSDDDDHAQLIVDGAEPEVFPDDALTAFMLRAYRDFAAGRTAEHFGLHGDVVRLMTAAKRCGLPTGAEGTGAEGSRAHAG